MDKDYYRKDWEKIRDHWRRLFLSSVMLQDHEKVNRHYVKYRNAQMMVERYS